MENSSLANLELQKELVEEQIKKKWWWNFWTTIIFWIGILIFLAFLGFNVFSALGETSEVGAKILDKIKKFISTILNKFGIDLHNSSSENSEIKKTNKPNGLINNISNSKISGIDSIKQSISSPNQNLNNQEEDEKESIKNDEEKYKSNIDSPITKNLQKKDSNNESLTKKRFPISDKLPTPSESNIFNTIATGQGYCYIGSDKGLRTCVETKDVGSCPTGSGYQSLATCKNPNLRD